MHTPSFGNKNKRYSCSLSRIVDVDWAIVNASSAPPTLPPYTAVLTSWVKNSDFFAAEHIASTARRSRTVPVSRKAKRKLRRGFRLAKLADPLDLLKAGQVSLSPFV
jgi:hypothetical protein